MFRSLSQVGFVGLASSTYCIQGFADLAALARGLVECFAEEATGSHGDL